jgi:hypothetical protein
MAVRHFRFCFVVLFSFFTSSLPNRGVHIYSRWITPPMLETSFFEVGHFILCQFHHNHPNFSFSIFVVFPKWKVNRRRRVSSIDTVTSFLDVGVVYLCDLKLSFSSSLYSYELLCTCCALLYINYAQVHAPNLGWRTCTKNKNGCHV